MSDQIVNALWAALAAEATTAHRYTYFATIAEIEGHTEIARLFEELAESATCAAHGHLDLVDSDATSPTELMVGPTRVNLGAAMASELGDGTHLYPQLAECAHASGMADVASWAQTLVALKATHLVRLRAALTELNDGRALSSDATSDERHGRPPTEG